MTRCVARLRAWREGEPNKSARVQSVAGLAWQARLATEPLTMAALRPLTSWPGSVRFGTDSATPKQRWQLPLPRPRMSEHRQAGRTKPAIEVGRTEDATTDMQCRVGAIAII